MVHTVVFRHIVQYIEYISVWNYQNSDLSCVYKHSYLGLGNGGLIKRQTDIFYKNRPRLSLPKIVQISNVCVTKFLKYQVLCIFRCLSAKLHGFHTNRTNINNTIWFYVDDRQFPSYCILTTKIFFYKNVLIMLILG